MPDFEKSKLTREGKGYSTMSLRSHYDYSCEPTYIHRLWHMFAAMLASVAEVSHKNQDIEPFGL